MSYKIDTMSAGFQADAQPWHLSNRWIITFDGRLDNREDLIERLHSDLAGDSDVALAMAAYRKWGMAGFRFLLGDWALALWDAEEEVLCLARDFAGCRPLHYRVMSREIRWSSDLSSFLTLDSGVAGLDDTYLVNFVVFFPDTTRTPYKHVMAVPAGICVRIARGSVSHSVIWEPDLTARTLYARDEDYEDHLRGILRESVKCRLRSSGPVWAELSGGLDSSSLVCFARSLLANGDAQTPELETITYTFDESRSADERNYVSLVDARYGSSGKTLEERSFNLFSYGDSGCPDRPQIGPGRPAAVARLMKNRGASVLISGQGGDAVMFAGVRPYLELSELLTHCQFLKLHRLISQLTTNTKYSYWDFLLNDAVFPVLRGRGGIDNRKSALEPWMQSDVMAPHVSSEDTSRVIGSVTEGRRVAYDLIVDVVKLISLCYFRGGGPVDATYPYCDRRVVQFMLSVPFDQRVRPGLSRSLHRRAMEGILPEEIRLRNTKAGAQEVVCRAISREWPAIRSLMDDDALVAQKGYVSLPKLRAALERARAGHAPDVFSLIRIISLEVWLRSVAARLRPLVPALN